MATIGDTGAPSTNTIYYDSLLSSTLNAYRSTLIDNIYKESAFLTTLRDRGAVKNQDGGERIQIPLMYGRNDTVKSYHGEEIIDTTIQDELTSAFYEWREIAGTISITRREERQNSGEARILNLLESKIKGAEMSMREELNRQLLAGTLSGTTFVPGNGGKDLNPLGWFLRKDNTTDPTVGGNVGNIAGATRAWWRHVTAVADSGTPDTGNSFALSVSTWKGLQVAMKRLYNTCSRGSGGPPDLGVCNQETFEAYESGLDDKVRYTDTKMADQGFDAIKLRGATLIWDEIVPGIDDGAYAADATDGTLFLLNTKFYELVIDSETDIVTTPFVEPENQTVKTSKILFMGNACVSNLRKHGVLYGISKSITS
jgi:hypothetical protein